MSTKSERSARIRVWTMNGVGSDTDLHKDEVWWGYWRQVGGEEAHPPSAMFRTEEEAEAWGVLVGDAHEWHVGPVVVDIYARDNFAVPK